MNLPPIKTMDSVYVTVNEDSIIIQKPSYKIGILSITPIIPGASVFDDQSLIRDEDYELDCITQQKYFGGMIDGCLILQIPSTGRTQIRVSNVRNVRSAKMYYTNESCVIYGGRTFSELRNVHHMINRDNAFVTKKLGDYMTVTCCFSEHRYTVSGNLFTLPPNSVVVVYYEIDCQLFRIAERLLLYSAIGFIAYGCWVKRD